MTTSQPEAARQRTESNGDTLMIHVPHTGKLPFALSELVYLQSHKNYTWLYWANGRRMLLSRTLKYVQAWLPVHAFVRLHRHHAVNSRYVVGLCQTGKGLAVTLSTGQSLVVSRRRRQEVQAQFKALSVRSETALDETR